MSRSRYKTGVRLLPLLQERRARVAMLALRGMVRVRVANGGS